MVSEVELRSENDIRSLDNVKKFDVASFYKWKKKVKNIFLAVKNTLL